MVGVVAGRPGAVLGEETRPQGPCQGHALGPVVDLDVCVGEYWRVSPPSSLNCQGLSGSPCLVAFGAPDPTGTVRVHPQLHMSPLGFGLCRHRRGATKASTNSTEHLSNEQAKGRSLECQAVWI